MIALPGRIVRQYAVKTRSDAGFVANTRVSVRSSEPVAIALTVTMLALRERSYAAPDEVLAFCGEYADRLSPLTRREALKALRRKGVETG